MKNVLSFLLVLITSMGFLQAADFPIDFEAEPYSFVDFDGGAATVIANPQSMGLNTSANVVQMIKSAGEVWGGSKLPLSAAIDFTTNQVFTMKVFSPRVGVPVLLKLENADGTVAAERSLNSTVANEWETLTYDFTGSSSDVFNNLVLIFDLGVVGDGSADFTFLIDDISFIPSEDPSVELPIDFETGPYSFIDFDGGVATLLTNTESAGINTSATVAQLVRDGGQTWAGSKLILGSKIDFSTASAFSMKVFSARADVPVLFKLEGEGGVWAERSTPTTKANEWETLTWDFTGEASDTYNTLVFMFDFGATGDGSANSTFLFDDVELFDNTGGLSQIDLPLDFEGETVNYALTDFGGNATVLGVDPSDATNAVAITTKTTGAETWAGTTMGTNLGFASVIPFTETETKMSVKVYSPAIGIQVRLKVEDHNDATLTAETEATTTVANDWEVLEFDFSTVAEGTNPFNLATNFDKASIFFNFGVVGSDMVYYWDDVRFIANVIATSPSEGAPIPPTRIETDVISIFSEAYTDVSDTNFNPDWGQATVVTTEDIAGNSTLKYANLTYQGTEFASQDVSGMEFLHIDLWTADDLDVNVSCISAGLEKSFAFTIVTGSWQSYDIPLTEFSDVVDLSQVFQFKFDGTDGPTIYLDNIYFYKEETVAGTDATLSDLFVDGTLIEGFNSNVASYTVELDKGTTLVPTVTATTTDNAANAVVTPASAIPGTTTVLVTAADGETEKTYSVEFIETPDPVVLPFDFETGLYEFLDFDGGVASVIANPQLSGINTSATVAQIIRDGGQMWGGSKIILTDNIDFSTESTISMKVYSERAGVPVLFKLEGAGGAATELSTQTTLANEWETLTWDFSAATSGTYNTVVFMFDFGTVGDGTANSTFLFDDVMLGVPSTTSNTISEIENLKVYSYDGNIFVNCDEELIHGKIDLYDLTGRRVLSSLINTNNTMLNVNQKGIYIVRISNALNHAILTKKVLVY